MIISMIFVECVQIWSILTQNHLIAFLHVCLLPCYCRCCEMAYQPMQPSRAPGRFNFTSAEVQFLVLLFKINSFKLFEKYYYIYYMWCCMWN